MSNEWRGDGLPPVGTVCMTSDLGEEMKVKILAYAGGADGADYVMACKMRGDREDHLYAWMAGMCDFSPLKTPEQIAAEEREKAAKQICVDAGSPELTAGQMAVAYRLYDAGYRKTKGGAA